jgi:hypothetical protein
MQVGDVVTTIELIKEGYTLASCCESGEWWVNRAKHLLAYINHRGTVVKIVPE